MLFMNINALILGTYFQNIFLSYQQTFNKKVCEENIINIIYKIHAYMLYYVKI